MALKVLACARTRSPRHRPAAGRSLSAPTWRPAGSAPSRPASLIYWARDPAWLAYDAEFHLLARRYPPFEYLPVVRDPGAGWQGEKGEAVELVERAGLAVPGLITYVSGGGEMIRRVRAALLAKGMERKAIKWEKFW